MKRVPRFVAQQYKGGSHEFRAMKREAVDAMIGHLGSLMPGSFYFPGDAYKHAKAIQTSLHELRRLLTTRSWGR